ncbi:hypothetical protein [Wolbachia endosymbiont (group A) of Nomada goodeniana]|uniref:hypothetical protein n=1 Tax=Wolbachia endosymbiont (group A) of Nomada goodeniana TaxID=3066207 RepID=UPI00334061CD
MLHEVTSVIELVGWTMQGTTEVKEWSPEIPEDIEVDMFMAMEDNMKDNVKASYHSLYRDLRPCHVLKWTSSGTWEIPCIPIKVRWNKSTKARTSGRCRGSRTD